VVNVGVTYVEGVVTGPTGKHATVRFLVDSGATYTLVPYDISKALDLVPKRTVAFTLADGTTIERAVSECHLVVPEGEGHTPVIMGEPGDEALLGVVTLEILGLILHPFKRTLEPMRMLLAQLRAAKVSNRPAQHQGLSLIPNGLPTSDPPSSKSQTINAQNGHANGGSTPSQK
jgi:predicted aspartyl protease